MFTTTIRINTQELNNDVITSIKKMYGKRDIEIVVSEALDETEYLLRSKNNKKHLLKSLREARNTKNLVTLTTKQFKEFNKKKLA